MTFGDYQFASPWWLLGLAVLPVLAWFFAGRGPLPAVRFSGLAPLRKVAQRAPAGWGGLGRLSWLLALALLILGLARPRLGKTLDFIESSGVDIVLALDVSGSMYAEDFTLGGERASRLEVVKDVTGKFIEKRPHDRIGIVAFAGRPYLVSPLTLDHDWLNKNLERLRIGLIGENGTAIGAAIASGTNRLKDRPAKSKILILLTDGDETVPYKVSPKDAAEAAHTLGVKIYTIAAGTEGLAPMPRIGRDGVPLRDFYGNKVYGPSIPVSVDEASLREIAKLGDGQFFRATDTASLDTIFAQIDKLEKTDIKMEHKVEWRELFGWFIAAGTALGAFNTVWRLTAGRTLP